MLKMELKSLELQFHYVEWDFDQGEHSPLATEVLGPRGLPMEKGSQNSDGEEIERLAPRENLANSKKEIERMEADVSKLKKAQEMLCEVYKNNIGFLQVRNVGHPMV
ncbi:hypothetical protein PPACK8108_LOCUS10220 [Phakopsora pachyrhizi]|uniref:Uncharacterized protein n=1 Tax=Phakopsora pachyrhizi TaxID=170000 RepID=A0AAV0AXY5_PHAPC|nr:hypothetical protein PPACK8108_LOCUS10220 [Phakopsora pachyrhizi]